MTWGGFDSHLVFDWVQVSDREDKRRKGDKSQPLRFVCVKTHAKCQLNMQLCNFYYFLKQEAFLFHLYYFCITPQTNRKSVLLIASK